MLFPEENKYPGTGGWTDSSSRKYACRLLLISVSLFQAKKETSSGLFFVPSAFLHPRGTQGLFTTMQCRFDQIFPNYGAPGRVYHLHSFTPVVQRGLFTTMQCRGAGQTPSVAIPLTVGETAETHASGTVGDSPYNAQPSSFDLLPPKGGRALGTLVSADF